MLIAIRIWFSTQFNRIKTWWSNNHVQIKQNVQKLGKCSNKLGKIISRFMIIGIILNVITRFFYPEFPERFPTIYGWFDGWLQFGEFIFKTAFGGIYSLFSGHLSEFSAKFFEALQALWHQFTNWLSSISF